MNSNILIKISIIFINDPFSINVPIISIFDFYKENSYNNIWNPLSLLLRFF